MVRAEPSYLKAIKNSIYLNKSNVILVSLHPTDFSFIGESHGISVISGYLKSVFNDINVYLYDQQLDSLIDILNSIKQFKPSILGISLKIKTFEQFQILYKMITKEIPKEERPVIILGNSIPHFNGKTILTKYFSDVLIGFGEGEIVMGDLYNYICNKQSFQTIRNIMYLSDDGKVQSTFKSYLNGNNILLPDRTRTLEFYSKGGEIYIEGSRGCAYCGCKICECKDFLGSRKFLNKWRPRAIDVILLDLKNLIEFGIVNVTFSDEDFFGYDDFGIDRAIELAKVIISSNININFRINARVKSIYNENDSNEMRLKRKSAIKVLKKAGLVKIFLGLESGSPTQLKRYGKGFKISEFENAYLLLNDLYVDYELGFILIDPLMNFNELKENINFIETNNCFSKISSIYKKLRIQSGNKSYLNSVKYVENKEGIKIIDDLDFNKQKYEIVSYVDDRIVFIDKLMNKFSKTSYKLYYLLRIYTQYSQPLVNENDSLQSTYFKIMSDLKKIEFDLLKELVKSIELNGINFKKSNYFLVTYEKKKRIVF